MTIKEFLSTILTILLLGILIRTCNNANEPNNSFAKEIAKQTRGVYDDIVEGLRLKDTSKIVKIDTIKKDSIDVNTDDWMKFNK